MCQVGDLFLEIFVKDDADMPPPEAQEIESVKVNEHINEHHEDSHSGPKGKDVLAAPFVRGLIKKYGLDINAIRGTGPDGRITEHDVEAAVKGPKSVPPPSPTPPKEEKTVSSKPSQPPSPPPVAPPPPRTFSGGASESVSMSPFERGMQKSMTESNTIPHLYLH